jgi:hypothetical protein
MLNDTSENILHLSSWTKSKPSTEQAACLDYRLTLKMEVTCATETLVNSYQTTPCHLAEDSTLHCHCCNLTSSNTTEVSPLFLDKWQQLLYVIWTYTAQELKEQTFIFVCWPHWWGDDAQNPI